MLEVFFLLDPSLQTGLIKLFTFILTQAYLLFYFELFVITDGSIDYCQNFVTLIE